MRALVRCGLMAALTLAAGLTAAAPSETSSASYEAFARELQESLSPPCDPSFLQQHLDLERFMDIASSGLELTDAHRRAFLNGLRPNFQLGEQICSALAAGGSYKLRNLRIVDGQPRALFRMVSEGGANYHDLRLARTGRTVAVADIYVFINGDWMSGILRRNLIRALAHEQRGLVDRVLGRESDFIKHLPQLTEMQRLIQERSFVEALATFQELPPSLRQEKSLMMQRVFMAQQVGDEAYGEALRDLHVAYGNDPDIALTLIDYFVLREEWATALKLTDRVDAEVGPDPYLDVLRAGIHYGAGHLDKAYRAAERARRAEPDLEDAYWTLVTVSLERRDFEETARLLSEIETGLGIELSDLEQFDEYAEFVQSPAYGAWVQRRLETR